jgi:hypothetical protein
VDIIGPKNWERIDGFLIFEFVTKGKSITNNFPLDWLPNVELCTIHMEPGVTLHLNLYILGSETIRSTNFTDKLELSIVNSTTY